MNDFRPVALTPIIMKCFERIVLKHIKLSFSPLQDNLQFAYRSGRSVDDAILLFLNNVYTHLDVPRSYCRILFVDFSSAFNTIQPHILVNKLKNDLKKKYRPIQLYMTEVLGISTYGPNGAQRSEVHMRYLKPRSYIVVWVYISFITYTY